MTAGSPRERLRCLWVEGLPPRRPSIAKATFPFEHDPAAPKILVRRKVLSATLVRLGRIAR